jgi:hypothetical protein
VRRVCTPEVLSDTSSTFTVCKIGIDFKGVKLYVQAMVSKDKYKQTGDNEK